MRLTLPNLCLMFVYACCFILYIYIHLFKYVLFYYVCLRLYQCMFYYIYICLYMFCFIVCLCMFCFIVCVSMFWFVIYRYVYYIWVILLKTGPKAMLFPTEIEKVAWLICNGV